jgi:hypothetical protein
VRPSSLSNPDTPTDLSMNTALWIAQGFAALVFLVTGTLKLTMPKERLATKMHWAASWPPGRIKLLGVAEVAGALGLVLPEALNIAPILTPISALCLALLLLGAVQTHRRLQENAAAAVVLLLVCVVIVAGRLPLVA